MFVLVFLFLPEFDNLLQFLFSFCFHLILLGFCSRSNGFLIKGIFLFTIQISLRLLFREVFTDFIQFTGDLFYSHLQIGNCFQIVLKFLLLYQVKRNDAPFQTIWHFNFFVAFLYQFISRFYHSYRFNAFLLYGLNIVGNALPVVS